MFPRLLLVLFLAILRLPALADTGVPSISATETSKEQFQGKIVKLTFLCRGNVTADTADGGKSGELVDSATVRLKVDVEVPNEGVEWFMRLPTTDAGGGPVTVYARMTKDKFGEPVAKLLGISVRTDAKGSRFVW